MCFLMLSLFLLFSPFSIFTWFGGKPFKPLPPLFLSWYRIGLPFILVIVVVEDPTGTPRPVSPLRMSGRRPLPLLLLLLELSVVLLEALAEALGHGHVLLDAAGDAAGLAARQRLGAEVVDARYEAVVYQAVEELLPVGG